MGKSWRMEKVINFLASSRLTTYYFYESLSFYLVTELEEQLDEADERSEAADAKVKDLETQNTLIGNSHKSMVTNEGAAADRVSQADSKISEMVSQVEEKEEAATSMETQWKELEDEMDKLALEEEEAKLAFDKKQEELQLALAEINEL